MHLEKEAYSLKLLGVTLIIGVACSGPVKGNQYVSDSVDSNNEISDSVNQNINYNQLFEKWGDSKNVFFVTAHSLAKGIESCSNDRHDGFIFKCLPESYFSSINQLEYPVKLNFQVQSPFIGSLRDSLYYHLASFATCYYSHNENPEGVYVATQILIRAGPFSFPLT